MTNRQIYMKEYRKRYCKENKVAIAEYYKENKEHHDLVNKLYRLNQPIEYETFRGMLQRCYYPKATSYTRYGGKGITVCHRWLPYSKGGSVSFERAFKYFIKDMGPKPSKDYSIDRIDPSKGYNPFNCRWITKQENSARSGKP